MYANSSLKITKEHSAHSAECHSHHCGGSQFPSQLSGLSPPTFGQRQHSNPTGFLHHSVCLPDKTGISNEPFAWILPIDPKQNNVYSNDSGIVYHTTQPINSSPKPDKRRAKVPWAAMSIVPKPERPKLW